MLAVRLHGRSRRAQQAGRIQHVGVLTGFDDPDLKAFQQELGRLGWSEGQNLHIDYRYSPAGTGAEALAKELVALGPEVILAQSRPATTALHKATDTIPIVFVFVTDPIGAGLIKSLPSKAETSQDLKCGSPASPASD